MKYLCSLVLSVLLIGCAVPLAQERVHEKYPGCEIELIDISKRAETYRVTCIQKTEEKIVMYVRKD